MFVKKHLGLDDICAWENSFAPRIRSGLDKQMRWNEYRTVYTKKLLWLWPWKPSELDGRIILRHLALGRPWVRRGRRRTSSHFEKTCPCIPYNFPIMYGLWMPLNVVHLFLIRRLNACQGSVRVELCVALHPLVSGNAEDQLLCIFLHCIKYC